MRENMKQFVVIFLIVTVTKCGKIPEPQTVSYNGYKTLEIQPQNSHHVEVLKALELEEGVDFWMPPNDAVSATAMLAPDMVKMFRSKLLENNIPFNMSLKDVGQTFEEEKELQRIASKLIKMEHLRNDLSHMIKYLRYNEIVSSLNTIVEENSAISSLEEIGKSFEQRPMYMLKLSTNATARKPIVFIEAGTHAREWLSPALALYTINSIVREPSLLDKQDWYFVPLANPDGYEYSHTKDRLWRKTRSYRPNVSKYCVGTDPNRNYDIYWAKVGTSANPCDETYPGKEPFSEVETRNIRDAVHKIHKRVKTYISLHSFGPLILYSWGYTTTRASNWQHLDVCGQKAANKIAKENGPIFKVGSPAQILYASAGASDDYFKAAYGIPYTYTVELQGGGKSGFDPPPSAILRFVQEAYPGIIALASCWLEESNNNS